MILKTDVELMQSWKSLYTRLLKEEGKEDLKMLLTDEENVEDGAEPEPLIIKFSPAFEKIITNHCKLLFDRTGYVNHDSRKETKEKYRKCQLQRIRDNTIRKILSMVDNEVNINLARIELYFTKIKRMQKKGRYYVDKP